MRGMVCLNLSVALSTLHSGLGHILLLNFISKGLVSSNFEIYLFFPHLNIFGTQEGRAGLHVHGELPTSSFLEKLSLEKPYKSEQGVTDALILGQNSM